MKIIDCNIGCADIDRVFTRIIPPDGVNVCCGKYATTRLFAQTKPQLIQPNDDDIVNQYSIVCKSTI